MRRLDTPLGELALAPVEELMVERVLVGTYPQAYPPALDCARKLIAAALAGEVEADWAEVHRLASAPQYAVAAAVQRLIDEETQALAHGRPSDPDE